VIQLNEKEVAVSEPKNIDLKKSVDKNEGKGKWEEFIKGFTDVDIV
jgi:hypothetical protein